MAMNPRDRVAVIIAVGILSIVGVIVIGGLFIAHNQDAEVHTEVLTII